MDFQYDTERLELRLLRPEQADQVLYFYNKNRSFLEPVEPARVANFYTLAFHKANLTFEYNSFIQSNHVRYWLYKKTNPYQPIGSVCLSNFLKGSFQSCMLGYKLDQNCCGMGFMTETLNLLLPLAIEEYNFHRIEAMVMPENTPSIRLLERQHFLQEGYLHSYAQINGKWRDHLLYSYIVSNKNTESSQENTSHNERI